MRVVIFPGIVFNINILLVNANSVIHFCFSLKSCPRHLKIINALPKIHTLAVCTHAASDGYKPIYKSCSP